MCENDTRWLLTVHFARTARCGVFGDMNDTVGVAVVSKVLIRGSFDQAPRGNQLRSGESVIPAAFMGSNFAVHQLRFERARRGRPCSRKRRSCVCWTRR
jgi:hypothetical protein